VNKYILVFQIQNPESFGGIFGPGVVLLVQNDLTAGFNDVLQSLLERHDILSDVQSPSFGQWYAAFSIKQHALSKDIDEQLESLTAAGKQLIRRMMQRNFGVATGTRIDFKLAVLPVSDEIMDADILRSYIRTSLGAYASAGKQYSMIKRDEFTNIVDKQSIDIFLQPVVSLSQDKVVGYEVLSRGPSTSPVNQPAVLFGTASHFGLSEELEIACISKALNCLEKIPEPYWISMNVSPDLMSRPVFYDLVSQRHFRTFLPRIMFEITEHLPIPMSETIQKVVKRLKELGVSLALDDFGCGFSDIVTARILRPKIVKLCITIISRLGRHPQIEKDVRYTVDRITKLGGAVLGEGVERREQAEILKNSGVSLVQGYYYGRPRSIRDVMNA
jgi:EAL domain-containing protein (putative c-di-GMP-specific phosphodiesterase class I)